MKAFAELYQLLDQTNKTNAKVALLVDYFNASTASDKLWVLALFTGRTVKRTINTTQLRDFCCEYGNIAPWMFDECYQVVGDLAEVMASILPDGKGSDNPPGLQECIERIRLMKGSSDEVKKEVLFNTWSQLYSFERFVFNKLISGGFRIGVSQKLVCKALSLHTGVDENILAHRLMGNWSPDNTNFESLVLNASETENHSQPYPFCLAYAIDGDVADLGVPDDWQAEWKWDGIRGQLIVRGGEMYLWSRGEELVTDKFPELYSLKDVLPEGTVLDGELLPYKFNQPLAFRDLQLRLNRKNVSVKLQKDVPVIFMAYDLLESDCIDRRTESLEIRRARLETIVKLADTSLLIVSPLVKFSNWQDLALQRESSRAMVSEGLMVKSKSSAYETGRRKGAWWKWKVNPFTIDAVLIYAQKGHGRRANMYTDYTFALWDDGALVPFAKAYSGLTDEEIRKVDDFIKKNTKEKFGPVRSVNHELVFEIAFEAVNLSARHKSGVAVRFPRIQRWRSDKKPQDANSLLDLKALISL